MSFLPNRLPSQCAILDEPTLAETNKLNERGSHSKEQRKADHVGESGYKHRG